MTVHNDDVITGRVWVVTGHSPDYDQSWTVGVYTDESTARRVAAKPRRECEPITVDQVPVLG